MLIIIITMIFCICIAPFARIQSVVAYIITPSSTSGNCHNHFALLGRFITGQVHTLSALYCNIPHNRQVPDALWSTKQILIKYLAQGYKYAGRSGVRTKNIDGLVVMSPALFRPGHACSQTTHNNYISSFYIEEADDY